MLDIVVMEHNEYIPRSQLQVAEAPDQKQSPKVSKGMGKRGQQKQQQQQQQQPSISIPESMVTANGVPTAVMGFLEVRVFLVFFYLMLNHSLTVYPYRWPRQFRRCKCYFNFLNSTRSCPLQKRYITSSTRFKLRIQISDSYRAP